MPIRRFVLALCTTAAFAACAQAGTLEQTALYTQKARDCRAVDLPGWSHPTRKVMEEAKVNILRVELCNGGVYPIFAVALPGEPMVGVNDRFFNKLYARMSEANGWHPFSFVDPARGVIVYVDVTGKRELSVSYDEFEAPRAK